MYALIDPYWGDPQIVTDTISETFDACYQKSKVSTMCSLYSGLEMRGHAVVKEGSMVKLFGNGYTIKKIKMEILDD